MAVRMSVAHLHPRNSYVPPADVWTTWGDVGESQPDLTVQAYYDQLAAHMAAGGEIPPIEIGYWAVEMGGQVRVDGHVYVFNGHHRFAIARRLGWLDVPVINSCDPDARPVLLDEIS